MTKYVKSIKFSTSGETYVIRDAEQKSRLDTLEPQVAEKADTTTVNTALAGKQNKLTAGANITIENDVISATGGSGGGAVDSVNGKTGTVVLEAADVHAATEAQGALADTAVQPADIADMETQTHASGTYQTKLTSANAGNNVQITEESGVVKISATGGGSGSANWGSIGGTLSDQTDLKNALDAKLESGDLKTINNESLAGSGNIELLTSTDLANYYTKTEADAEFLTSNDVGTMASESKDDYYTKTAADSEFLSSNQGVENANKFLKVTSTGSITYDYAEVPAEDVEQAVSDYLDEHPVSGLSPEDEARVEAVEGQVFKSGVANTNLFNKHNIINGKYLISSGGLGTNASYLVSDYMELPTGSQYLFVNFTPTNRIAFYDENKTFISPLITLSTAGSTVDISGLDLSYRLCFKCVAIPAGAKYARLDMSYSEVNTQKAYTSVSLDAADLPPTQYIPWNNTEIDDEMTDVQDELSRVSMLSLEEVKAGELIFADDLELTYVYGRTWSYWAKTFSALEAGEYTFVIKNVSNLDTRLSNTISIDAYCSDTNSAGGSSGGRSSISYTPSGCTLNTIDGTAYLHFTLSNSNTMWSYSRVIRPRIQFASATAIPAPEVPEGETPPTSVTQYCRVVLYKGNVTATTLSNIVLGEEVVADLTTEITNEVKNAIDINGKLDKIYTKNLFDKNSVTTGAYWGKSGNKGSSASYAASALIPVQPNTYYYCTSCGAIGGSAYCVFAADKRTLLQTESGSDGFGTNNNLSGIANCILTPDNAAYLAVSIQIGSLNSAQVEIGQVGTTYEAYGDYLPVIELDARMTQAEADIQAMGGGQQWKDSAFHTTAATFNDGDVMTLGNNKDVKNHKQLTFYAKIAENGFSAMQLGHGDTSYGGTYIEVDDTNVKVYNYSTAASLSYTLPHGITEFKDYIQITIACRYDGIAELHIETFDQQYTKTNQSWSGCNGRIYAKSIGSTMTDATLSWSCDVLDKPIWLFGDSYLGLTSTARPYYYPIQEGYKNWIACGFPGAGNSQYECLINLLQLGKPKVAVWTIGMNCGDPDETTPQAAWVTATTNFITACKNAGVLPIISTIPSVDADGYSPDSGITGKRRNWAKDAWVRASGERYVDFAAAVDPDDDGVWLDGYLSSDSVHPAIPGAKALARQLLVDVPEMISTKVWA